MLASSFRISYSPQTFPAGTIDSHGPAQVMTRLLYDFVLAHGYSFILYADPIGGVGSAGGESKGDKRGKVDNGKVGFNSGRRLRALVSVLTGQKTGLLDVRRFIPSEPGFVFSPYAYYGDINNSGKKTTIFANASQHKVLAFSVDWVVDLDSCKFINAGKKKSSSQVLTGKWHISQKNSERSKALVADFLSAVHTSHAQPQSQLQSQPYISEINQKQSTVKTPQPKFNTSKKTFTDQVAQQVRALRVNEKSAKQIHSKAFKKVVLSKVKTIPLASSFDWVNYFYQLLADFPNSFVNFVTDKSAGTWMGASPEILVSRTADKIFKTVSLAGTRWEKNNLGINTKKSLLALPTHEVLWSEKEIQEQSVTSRFIIDCFKTLRLREYLEEGPYTVRKGNLLHLQSEFSVDLKRYFGESLPYDMLGLLHPTPAICGTPRNIAQEVIKRTELHARSYYAGYLGPIEVDKEINVYVNLRCMEFLKRGGSYYARLYAGCGINTFSDPEQEWEETEAKLALLIKTLSPKITKAPKPTKATESTKKTTKQRK